MGLRPVSTGLCRSLRNRFTSKGKIVRIRSKRGVLVTRVEHRYTRGTAETLKSPPPPSNTNAILFPEVDPGVCNAKSAKRKLPSVCGMRCSKFPLCAWENNGRIHVELQSKLHIRIRSDIHGSPADCDAHCAELNMFHTLRSATGVSWCEFARGSKMMKCKRK